MSKSNYVLAEEPAVDLAVLEAFAAELEEYIIKDELYRTVRVHVPAGDQMIQMSGGDLLTRIFRLSAERDRLTPEQQARFDAARGAAEKTIYSLRTRFHQRLQREVKARLDSLNWFLDECSSDPARCRGEYPFEIRNRQRIDAIVSELGTDLRARTQDPDQPDRRAHPHDRPPGQFRLGHAAGGGVPADAVLVFVRQPVRMRG